MLLMLDHTWAALPLREDTEMRRTTFCLWFCLWPLFLGVCLPYLTFPGGHKLINIFWGSIYGLGLWGIDKTIGLSIHSPFVAVGVVIWPIVVSSLMFILGRKLVQMNHRWLQLAIVLALVVSSLLVINLQMALQPPFSNLPTFYRLFFAVW
jgi:hypothetical protein